MPMRQITLNNGIKQHVFVGGWKRQMTDPRDEVFRLKLHRSMLGASQTKCDNRNICSAVEQQAELGACTANAFAGCVESNEIRGGAKIQLASVPTIVVSKPTVAADGTIVFSTSVKPAAQPTPQPNPPAPPAPARKLIDVSRLFHYYATRKDMGTTNEDSGATIRDTIKAGVTYGVVDEKLWPYDPTKYADNPPPAVWTQAATHKVPSYHAISDGDIETMKATLISGFLIEYGFVVYDYMLSDEMAKKGILCRPGSNESQQGGHAVDLVGFDDNMVMPDGSKGAFLNRNSWGPNWGQGGYFWTAYNYVADVSLASDHWVIQSSPI